MEGTPVTVRLDAPTLATVDELAASARRIPVFAAMPPATRSDVIRMMVTGWLHDHRRDVSEMLAGRERGTS